MHTIWAPTGASVPTGSLLRKTFDYLSIDVLKIHEFYEMKMKDIDIIYEDIEIKLEEIIYK